MRIRKISLQNAAGDRFDLNGNNGVYASNLEGFGFSLSPDFADLSRGFFQPINTKLEPQQPISFTVTFTKNPYQTYRRFLDWLAAAATLTVVYQPYGDVEYYRDVTVSCVQKGELSLIGWLEVFCSFLCQTPWYMPAPTLLTLETGAVGSVKRYPYSYTRDLRYGSDSTAALSGTIAASGHIPGAVEISYSGTIVNPRIRLTGNVSGKVYGTCAVAVTLEASDTLEFSTRYENSYVAKIAAGGAVTDLLDELDLIQEPFFNIPVDEPCTLSIESDSPISGKAQVRIYYYFRSV